MAYFSFIIFISFHFFSFVTTFQYSLVGQFSEKLENCIIDTSTYEVFWNVFYDSIVHMRSADVSFIGSPPLVIVYVHWVILFFKFNFFHCFFSQLCNVTSKWKKNWKGKAHKHDDYKQIHFAACKYSKKNGKIQNRNVSDQQFYCFIVVVVVVVVVVVGVFSRSSA